MRDKAKPELYPNQGEVSIIDRIPVVSAVAGAIQRHRSQQRLIEAISTISQEREIRDLGKIATSY
jgi:hypothetical protein